eukprot:scaffold39258_cov67-Phaeocystis_antarctica.AAC.3
MSFSLEASLRKPPEPTVPIFSSRSSRLLCSDAPPRTERPLFVLWWMCASSIVALAPRYMDKPPLGPMKPAKQPGQNCTRHSKTSSTSIWKTPPAIARPPAPSPETQRPIVRFLE